MQVGQGNVNRSQCGEVVGLPSGRAQNGILASSGQSGKLKFFKFFIRLSKVGQGR